MHTLKDVYRDYCVDSESPLSKDVFKSLCEEFNIMAIDYVLQGGILNLRNNLGYLSVRRIARNPKNPTIDWAESNKYKQELIKNGDKLFDPETGEGTKWFIYYTDKWYCKFHWEKAKCTIPNKSAYRFSPSRGLKGNKEKLINLLKTDDLAYLRFKSYGNI
jgi:hypothetical protein